MIGAERLPSGWKLVPMRRVLRKLARPIAEDDGVVTAYRDGVVTLRSIRRDEGYTFSDTEFGYQGVEPGDLVFHALDGFAGAVGVSDSRGKCSPVYHVCDAPAGDDVRYVAAALRAMGFTGFLAIQVGNVRQRSVDFRAWEALARIPLPRPPHRDQTRLADLLEAETARIDALIEKKQRMIALFQERRVSITDSAIWDERGSDRPMAALAAYINGWPFKPDDFTTSGLPVVRIAQLVDPAAPTDYFDGALPDRVRLQDGDLVFSWSASLQVRIWSRGPGYLNQHLYRVVPAEGIDKMWLRFALDAATRRLAGLMHGSAMTHITQPMMKQLRVPLPDIARQRQIASRLDDAWGQIDSVVEGLLAQIDLLNEHRQALITAAVTGQLDVSRAAA